MRREEEKMALQAQHGAVPMPAAVAATQQQIPTPAYQPPARPQEPQGSGDGGA